MLFNSLEFLVFFPVVVGLFYALPHALRKYLLLVASYLFYGAWSPLYALLLFATSVLDWWVAIRVEDALPENRRRWLLVSLVSNLGVLFTFKYYNLVNDTMAAAFGWFGGDWPLPQSSLLLPVGISFYTFQSLSYTVDVYRGQLKAERGLLLFVLYVAYFPQLVAGPIERASRLLPQLHVPVAFDWDRAASGMRLAAWGMFKKVVIADRLAEVVNIVYGDPRSFGGFGWVVATFFFGYQVYLDFSGYSDIAIGTARVLGVDLMRNFDQPYLARSPSELWSRWHISMTTWFRDYVYVPLGGNRVSTGRWVFNVYVVFVASGLWHGAYWSLAAWGALHATILVTERLTAGPRAWLQRVTGLARVPPLQAFVQWAITFALWQLTLVFFRSPAISDALYMITHVGTGWSQFGNPAALAQFLARVHLDGFLFAYCILLCPFAELVDYGFRSPAIRERLAAWPTWARWILDWLLITGILVLGSFGETPFVYFQF